MKSDLNFYQGKTIWITGASSGIGKALAIELSKLNTTLILSSRNQEKLEIIRKQCYMPQNHHVVPLDLENWQELSKDVNVVLNLAGKIDVLINNGGIGQRANALSTALEVDKKIMDVNYFGTIALTKALLPNMIKNQQGQIVVISSIVGRVGTPVRSTYAASKHALHGFFDSLRAEIYHKNISVNLVCPGYIKTNFSIAALQGDGNQQGIMDKTHQEGIDATQCAKKIIHAIKKNRAEIVIAKPRERFAYWLSRFMPSLLRVLVRKVNVT